MHLGRCIEAPGVLGAVVVSKVYLASQAVQAMHLVEYVDATEVAVVPPAPVGGDADSFSRILAYRNDLVARERNWPCVIQGRPGFVGLAAGLLAIDDRWLGIEECTIHAFRRDPYICLIENGW